MIPFDEVVELSFLAYKMHLEWQKRKLTIN